MSSDDEEAQPSLFVFYKTVVPAPSDVSWPEVVLPDGWLWLGSGGTSGARFPNEDQYTGPLERMQDGRHALQTYFETLVTTGAIEEFVIQDAYLPVPT